MRKRLAIFLCLALNLNACGSGRKIDTPADALVGNWSASDGTVHYCYQSGGKMSIYNPTADSLSRQGYQVIEESPAHRRVKIQWSDSTPTQFSVTFSSDWKTAQAELVEGTGVFMKWQYVSEQTEPCR